MRVRSATGAARGRRCGAASDRPSWTRSARCLAGPSGVGDMDPVDPLAAEDQRISCGTSPTCRLAGQTQGARLPAGHARDGRQVSAARSPPARRPQPHGPYLCGLTLDGRSAWLPSRSSSASSARRLPPASRAAGSGGGDRRGRPTSSTLSRDAAWVDSAYSPTGLRARLPGSSAGTTRTATSSAQFRNGSPTPNEIPSYPHPSPVRPVTSPYVTSLLADNPDVRVRALVRDAIASASSLRRRQSSPSATSPTRTLSTRPGRCRRGLPRLRERRRPGRPRVHGHRPGRRRRSSSTGEASAGWRGDRLAGRVSGTGTG